MLPVDAGGVDVPAAGFLMTCPTLITLGLLIPLYAARSDTLTPHAAAISESVSPDRTVYVSPLTGVLGVDDPALLPVSRFVAV